MRRVALLLLVLILPTMGCVVHTRPASKRRAVVVSDCPPNHHWDGKKCKKDKKPKHWK